MKVVLAHSPDCTHMCTFLQDLLRSQASVAPPSSRGSSLLEILLWIDVSSQINPQTKNPSCFYAAHAAPPMPPMCKYVRIRGQHVRGRGRQRSVPVRHVFARIFARIPRIWGHVFCDSNPRISRVLTATPLKFQLRCMGLGIATGWCITTKPANSR